jgi:hypothetical protein
VVDLDITHFALNVPFRFDFSLLVYLGLLLDHPEERTTPSLQLLRRQTLEEPINMTDGELRDILRDKFVQVVCSHPVVMYTI